MRIIESIYACNGVKNNILLIFVISIVIILLNAPFVILVRKPGLFFMRIFPPRNLENCCVCNDDNIADSFPRASCSDII